MRRPVILLLLVVSVLASAGCATTPPVLPAEAKWVEPPVLPGAKLAVLAGNPTQPGLSTYRIWFPANYKIPAHFHPATENVTVISGTIWVGLGDKLDPSKGTAYPAGSFATVAANQRHYAWTTEETVIQVHLVGPTGMTFANPVDDPRRK